MSEAVRNGAAATAAPVRSGKTERRTPKPLQDLGAGASTTARRQAAAILEVLAGARTPVAAAQALGVSLPRYYVLEVRALQGMLVACEPRPLGRQQTAGSALASVQRECEQLRRECTRQQALLRAAQRTIGLAAPAPAAAKPDKKGGQRRRRRPTARGLRAAACLRSESTDAAPTVALVAEGS